jgi:hypothetical protein
MWQHAFVDWPAKQKHAIESEILQNWHTKYPIRYHVVPICHSMTSEYKFVDEEREKDRARVDAELAIRKEGYDKEFAAILLKTQEDASKKEQERQKEMVILLSYMSMLIIFRRDLRKISSCKWRKCE